MARKERISRKKADSNFDEAIKTCEEIFTLTYASKSSQTPMEISEQHVSHQHWLVRQQVAHCLHWSIDTITNSFVIFDKLASDRDWRVRQKIASVLNHHFSLIPSAHIYFHKFLHDESEEVRAECLRCLSEHFHEITNAHEITLDLLKDDKESMRVGALSVLHDQRKEFDTFSEILRTMSVDSSEVVRSAVGGLLWSASFTILSPEEVFKQFGNSAATEIKSALALLLRDKYQEVSSASTYMLAFLTDQDPRVQLNALFAFKKVCYLLEPQHFHALTALCEQDEPNPEVAAKAMYIKTILIEDIDSRKRENKRAKPLALS